MKIKLVIHYDGTRFMGWQRQPGKLTIQGKIEDALYKLYHRNLKIYGASRTDAGVHAKGQVAHFIAPITGAPPKNLAHKINPYLPSDIRIRSAEKVADDFHARESARSKRYEYVILNHPHEISTSLHLWWVTHPLDIVPMNEACQYLLGSHDFSSFQSSGSHSPTPIREIFEAFWKREKDHVIFTIRGSGFLKFMVRNLVGTLTLVGQKKITPLDFKAILEKKNRSDAGATAPACGLTLIEICYA
ncbi:MAG: tRNA pseudouridine(38-40) synthase TruA [Deltaproteobacteria bacterium]|nr:tRNA pseudouridine(38-40) synthase TruA [Deltaproteobacteria bacterium]